MVFMSMDIGRELAYLCARCRSTIRSVMKTLATAWLMVITLAFHADPINQVRDDVTPAHPAINAKYHAYLPVSVRADTTVFAVIGDYGSINGYEALVASLVKRWSPAFIATVGDNNYPSGAAATIDAAVGQYFASYIYPYYGTYPYTPTVAINRFFPALGNHDWLAPGAAPYLSYFTLPGNERYYDIVRGPVHLFFLDSDAGEPDGVTATSTQGVWLKNQLALSTSCWNLVFVHHAPYSSSTHGSNTFTQWPYQAWGAQAVFSGHDHTYERVMKNGMPYIVNGAGGSALYPFGAAVAGSAVRYNTLHGAMRITATTSTLTMQFVNINNIIVDTLALNGRCS